MDALLLFFIKANSIKALEDSNLPYQSQNDDRMPPNPPEHLLAIKKARTPEGAGFKKSGC